MPYQGKMQQQSPEEHKKARPEEQFVPKQQSFGMPNSLMQAVPMTQPGTPNSVMREMDADDSGALFRGRGFDSTVGAHELSHTVRRESAHGPVRQTVPSGTIQRWLWDNKDNNGDIDEDEFEKISGGDIEVDQQLRDYYLYLQMKKSKEKGASGAKKNAKSVAKSFKEREDYEAKVAAAQMAGLREIEEAEKKQRLRGSEEAKKRFKAKPDHPEISMKGPMDAYEGSSQYKEEEPGVIGKIKRFLGIGR